MEAKRQVIVLQGYDFGGWLKPVGTCLRRTMGIPEGTDEPMPKLFSKPATTLIIDHADLLMRDKDNRDVEFHGLVRALIEESRGEDTKRHTAPVPCGPGRPDGILAPTCPVRLQA